MNEGSEQSPSLREALSAAFDEAATRTEGEATSQVEIEAKPGPGAEAGQSTQVEAAALIDPPAHWSDEHKETFKTLPPQGQKFILDRHKGMESDYTRKTTELAEQRKAYDRYAAIDKVFEPLRPKLQAAGLDEVTAVQRILAAQQYLESNPKEAITHFAKQYGVQLGDAGSNQFVDPDLQKVNQELAQLKSTLAQREQAEKEAQQRQLLDQIESFKSTVDESGQAKYPHFRKLRGTMAGLLHTREAKDLADAYDRAAWAHPEVRTEILARQQADAEAKAKAAAAEKVRDAQGRFLPNGKGIPKPEPQAKKSLRDELDAQLTAAGYK